MKKSEKCFSCDRPPAAKGLEYCEDCGKAYVDALFSREREVKPEKKKPITRKKLELSMEDAANIRKRVKEAKVLKKRGIQRLLAEEYGIHEVQVSKIVNDKLLR